MFTKRHDGDIWPLFNQDGLPVPGTQDISVPGTHGLPVHGAQSLPVHGAQGLPVLGAQDMPVPEAQANGQNAPVIEWRDLTHKQQQVLEWLARFLRGQEREIAYIYRRIGKDLEMTKRAVRVHMDALKAKGLIVTSVMYRPNFRQKIGLKVSISIEAPIKHLPHKMSKKEIYEMKKRMEREQQVWALIRKGYTLVPELNAYVLEPDDLKR